MSSVAAAHPVHSETGSGKTATFALPILNKLFRDPKGIFALVIVPNREIALQICEQVAFYGSINTVNCVALVGGVDSVSQRSQLEKAPHFVVGTPGRLADQLAGSEKAQKLLRNLEFVVFDEADKLMEETLFVFIKQVPGLDADPGAIAEEAGAENLLDRDSGPVGRAAPARADGKAASAGEHAPRDRESEGDNAAVPADAGAREGLLLQLLAEFLRG